jgi:hypothetical protein
MRGLHFDHSASIQLFARAMLMQSKIHKQLLGTPMPYFAKALFSYEKVLNLAMIVFLSYLVISVQLVLHVYV